ncbi:Hypothetical protein Cul05146_1563 [Corynebacterium ulcerans]|nr:Hypothetical protein Cul05146_1563 [Corynebacterium ulcerans]
MADFFVFMAHDLRFTRRFQSSPLSPTFVDIAGTAHGNVMKGLSGWRR